MSRLIGCETEIANNAIEVARLLVEERGHPWSPTSGSSMSPGNDSEFLPGYTLGGLTPIERDIYHREGCCTLRNCTQRQCVRFWTDSRQQRCRQPNPNWVGNQPVESEPSPVRPVFSGLHGYHCRCGYCIQDENRENFWSFQRDPTVNGEFVSRPAAYNAPATVENLRELGYAMILSGVRQATNAGNHVHVDVRDLDDLQLATMFQLYLRFQHDDLEKLAAGQFNEVRGYNSPNREPGGWVTKRGKWSFDVTQPRLDPQDFRRDDDGWGRRPIDWDAYYRAMDTLERPKACDYDTFLSLDLTKTAKTTLKKFAQNARGRGKGPWCSIRENNRTVEFRLWNGTASPIRLMLYTSVSAALVQAAVDGINPREDDLTLEKAVEPYLSVVARDHLHYHLTQPRDRALVERAGGRFWDPLTERRVSEPQTSLEGYRFYEVDEVGALTLA